MAFTMLFLPFFSIFGEPLLNALMGIMEWVVTYSNLNADSLTKSLEQSGIDKERWGEI